MICPKKSCGYEFCFICLQHFPCVSGPYEPCKLAPCQPPTSSRPPRPPSPPPLTTPPASQDDTCTIL